MSSSKPICSEASETSARVIVPAAFRWQALSGANWRGYARGPGAHRLAAKIAAASGMDEVAALLNEHPDFSGGILQGPGFVLAWADHIRSFPLYYAVKDGQLYLSPDARAVQEGAGLETPDSVSALEFAMAGYATGKHTLYEGLYVLQPGEILRWNGALKIERYFHYTPEHRESPAEENMKKLGAVMDEITQRIVDRAAGRPIWIPLSGGLDSRLILCRLHEYGYKNLHTFSYGPHFNFEALCAKKIAARLGVPWQFVAPRQAWLRALFESNERRAFWRFADGLKTVPCMREFSAFMWLKKNRVIPDDAVVINGQSGDYITGNHINAAWNANGAGSAAQLFSIIRDKHYDLWKDLRTPRNEGIMRPRIAELFPDGWEKFTSLHDLSRVEETWEYDGRQICYVLSGQRLYEFLGFEWELPLWERTLVDFCRTLPFEQKFGQKLYKDWLRSWNYKGLFPAKEPYIWRWPLPMLWVVPVAQLIGLVQGRKAKTRFYALMRYYGHYANQYAFFPRATHKATAQNARSVIALHVRQWIDENQALFPESLRRAAGVESAD